MTEFPSVPIGLLCSLIGGGTPNTSKPEYWSLEDVGVPWIAISDMSTVREVKRAKKYVTEEGVTATRLRVSGPGTVLFAMYASVGKHAMLEVPAVWNQAIVGLTPKNHKRLNSRFLYYSLESVQGLLPTLYRSTTQNNLNAEQVSQLRIPVPCFETQRRIVDYLDEEVREMDAQVALLEDLAKNLNSRSILFRNSKIFNNSYGAERKLWSLVSKKDEVSESKEYVALEDMESWTGVAKTRQAESRVTGIAYSPGDVLFGKLRPYLAKVYRAESSGVAVGDVHVYKANPEIDSRFLKHLLLTTDFVGYAEMNSTGVKMPRIEWPKISQFRVRVPTLPMQREIADELDRGTAEMDFLIKEAKDLIENLKARKTALITEVVTGRKKV
ncbi:restriction modification system DNA specificity domain-containing protein [Mycobacteroides abscessus subsp. abscessus]|nr:restriction modification system DNA specificity domain-containing protein [Mycobacteroides abscessus subsp. abscessus]